MIFTAIDHIRSWNGTSRSSAIKENIENIDICGQMSSDGLACRNGTSVLIVSSCSAWDIEILNEGGELSGDFGDRRNVMLKVRKPMKASFDLRS